MTSISVIYIFPLGLRLLYQKTIKITGKITKLVVL